jgi:hypothetical protein
MRQRKVAVSQGPFVYRSIVTDKLGGTYYFIGSYNSIDEFKDAVKSYYSENIDSVSVYYLNFTKISNVGKLDGIDDGKFIQV